MSFESVLRSIEFILGLLDLILQWFQSFIHFVDFLLHLFEVVAHFLVISHFLFVVLEMAELELHLIDHLGHYSKVFALRIFRDLVLQLLSTLNSLNIGFEMFESLFRCRSLMKSFVQIDFERSSLLAECLQRFVKRIEFVTTDLMSKTDVEAMKRSH